MTSKKKLKKINRKLMAEHLAIGGENEKLMAEFNEIADAWSTYQSSHPDLSSVCAAIGNLVDVGRERNSLIRRNLEYNERAEKKMQAWEDSLKDDTAPPDSTEIQREAVERDYQSLEEKLYRLLSQVEEEHTIIVGTESNGNVKAWIRVLFTDPPRGVDYTTSVFNYRGKNYLEYDKWNETKLRDVRLQQAQQTATDFEETVKKRNAYIEKQVEVIDDLKRTQELHESQIKAYKAEQLDSQRLIADLRRSSERVAAIEPPRNMDTAVAERANVYVPTEQDEQSAAQALAEADDYEATNMRDPRYRAAVEAMDEVRKVNDRGLTNYNQEGKPRIGNGDKTIGQKPNPEPYDDGVGDRQFNTFQGSPEPECAHAIIYRDKNEDKCTECGAVVWPKPERAFKEPF